MAARTCTHIHCKLIHPYGGSTPFSGHADELGSSVEAEPPTPHPQSLSKPSLRPTRPAPQLPAMPEASAFDAVAGRGPSALMRTKAYNYTVGVVCFFCCLLFSARCCFRSMLFSARCCFPLCVAFRSVLLSARCCFPLDVISRSHATCPTSHHTQTPSRRFSENVGGGSVFLDVRLPPLDPARSAQLLFLTAGFGSLFGGPVHQDRPGLLLQWGRAEGTLRWPDMPPEQARACEGWQQGVLRDMATKSTFTTPVRKAGGGQERGVVEDADAATAAVVTVRADGGWHMARACTGCTVSNQE